MREKGENEVGGSSIVTRLKYASIAQIENVDTLQGVEYLTKQEMHTDQAVWFQKRK